MGSSGSGATAGARKAPAVGAGGAWSTNFSGDNAARSPSPDRFVRAPGTITSGGRRGGGGGGSADTNNSHRRTPSPFSHRSQNVPPGNHHHHHDYAASATVFAASKGWSAEDREALRLARWIDTLGVSLRRAGSTLAGGGSPTKEGGLSSSIIGSGSGSKKFPHHHQTTAVAEFRKDPRLKPAAELAAACSDGTLLCELVGLLERKELTGVTWRPRAVASRLHNIGKALEALRRQPAMSPMNLWCEKDVLKRDVGAVLGLLADMQACTAYRKFNATLRQQQQQ